MNIVFEKYKNISVQRPFEEFRDKDGKLTYCTAGKAGTNAIYIFDEDWKIIDKTNVINAFFL